jgi:hypothetical protein
MNHTLPFSDLLIVHHLMATDINDFYFRKDILVITEKSDSSLSLLLGSKTMVSNDNKLLL